jgi:hypothetical protein
VEGGEGLATYCLGKSEWPLQRPQGRGLPTVLVNSKDAGVPGPE